jgi:protein TonB
MKKTENSARNKREDKKKININWNSRLFFQIGIITSLLTVFFIMQTDFEIKNETADRSITRTIEEPAMIEYVLDIDTPKPIEPIKKVVEKPVSVPKTVKSNVFVVKPNDALDIETPIAAVDEPIDETPVIVKHITKLPTPQAAPRSVQNVEFVPVFPGCEALQNNTEKIACMSSKINSFINNNFRKELLENLSPNETHRIYVKFKIDSNGFVADVVANAQNENLKKEVQRIINKLPKMKPGKQGNKNVDVIYTVPIVFKVQ